MFTRIFEPTNSPKKTVQGHRPHYEDITETAKGFNETASSLRQQIPSALALLWARGLRCHITFANEVTASVVQK